MSPDNQTKILVAARVITMAEDGSDATAVGVVGGRIVAVGDTPSLRHRMPEAEVVDLADAVLVPGFNDAHMHPTMAAEDLLHVDLSADRVRTRSQLVDILVAAARTTPPGEWIRASRYDHMASTGGRILDRDALDAISRQHPIVIVHVGAHWGVVNSLALAKGGIAAESTPPRGGEYGRDATARPNGVLYEQALFDFVYPAMASGRTVVPESGLEERLRGLHKFLWTLNAAGITSACDAMAGPGSLRLLQAADARDLLTVRTGLLLAYPHASRLHDLGMTTGFGSDRLRFVGIKAFVDGAIAGRTCLLSESPGDDHHGMQVLDDAELDSVVRAVHMSGSRLAVHANGDIAIMKLLDAVERVQLERPRPNARHRVEHCTVVSPEIVDRLARAGMTAVPFGSYVSFHGDKLLEWYGPELLERMFPHRWLLDAGVSVAGSSDYPCGPYEPLRAIESCVTRKSADGTILGGSQRITAAEALALYTTGAAYAAGEEHVKGRIAPGYLADFAALGADPLRTDPESIGEIPVLSTWVGGSCVWDADNSGGPGVDSVELEARHASSAS